MVLGKTLSMSPWIFSSSSVMIFFLFHLLQLIESPLAQLGKLIAWNNQSSSLSENVQRRLGLALNCMQIIFLGLSTEFNWIHSQDLSICSSENSISIIFCKILETQFCIRIFCVFAKCWNELPMSMINELQNCNGKLLLFLRV